MTAAMRDEVRRRLEARGVQMADSMFAARDEDPGPAAGLRGGAVRVRAGGGAAPARERRSADRQAVALLRQATTPQALLGLASGSAARAH